MDKKEKAVDNFKSILSDIHPVQLLPDLISWDKNHRILKIGETSIQIRPDQDMYVIGAGKASATMAAALEKILGDEITAGQVIVPGGTSEFPSFIKTMEGSHPVPDSKSVTASQHLLRFIKNIPEDSVVLNVLSGGTSSLFCIPADNLSIEEIQTVFGLLIQSGASIQEINTVRKSLSGIKGGRLLNHLRHTTLIDLIISDVPDDDRRFIGSGPTTAQEISFEESVSLLGKYSLREKVPHAVQQYLSYRQEHEKKEGKPFFTEDFDSHYSIILMSAMKLAQSTAQHFEQEGFKVDLNPRPWSGKIEAFEEHILSKIDAAVKTNSFPKALVFVGECTINVTGTGLGGRNQELALRMAKHLADFKSDREIIFLSAGTDGIDGPTDAAGAVVDQATMQKARDAGINPEDYLESNDSYHFFKQAGGHIITGPTGNNLMDLQIALIF